MTYVNQWIRRPQNIWLRRAIFQIHLWTGIGLGLYIFFISVTGSALVFRNEIYKYFTAKPTTVQVLEKKLSKEELTHTAERAYPGYGVSYIWEAKKPDEATEVWMSKDSSKLQRLFDPYTGKDLGRSIPLGIEVMKWTAELHTDLLMGKGGEAANGIGGFFLALLCVTGLVIWWPGVASWKRALMIKWSSGWKRFNWDMHSAFGLWTISIVFIFGITGAYLVFTMPFQRVINRFFPLNVYRIDFDQASVEPAAPQFVTVADEGKAAPQQPPAGEKQGKRGRRPPPQYSFGDKIIRWASWLHFGNFAGWKTKVLWIILGLIPPLLFVTGTIMWWNRVLSKEARRTKARTRVQATAAAVEVGASS